MTEEAAPDQPVSPRRRGRPRTAPDQSETRAKLIRAGLAHLTERGYGASGVDEILSTAGVPKGSFYHHFGSKEAFGSELIAAYDAYFLTVLDRNLDDTRRAPIDRLRAFAKDAEAGMARHGFRRGCLIGNLGQEMPNLPDSFRARLSAVLDGWQDRTEACLAKAEVNGDPKALAQLFWTGWEGAVLRARMVQGPEPLHAFTQSYFSLISKT
ncbi:TetR/AcrR family transcriptional repressor of nem operon [Sagittula marina]|uniref:TetR/AcrR family transcriptional repressor of nem operon n=1 Tax=Sagittula marina TaxID=943940 RepID=A0A7W6DSQ2_9RHOB|nr:TetR/AcrR family transcriptional regulator [Sagittula marina]MBB3986217.1 TetR/AcrR family transcriptional repressor of nem operon [Sagittula marina]